jgi:hypothetical protein
MSANENWKSTATFEKFLTDDVSKNSPLTTDEVKLLENSSVKIEFVS